MGQSLSRVSCLPLCRIDKHTSSQSPSPPSSNPPLFETCLQSLFWARLPSSSFALPQLPSSSSSIDTPAAQDLPRDNASHSMLMISTFSQLPFFSEGSADEQIPPPKPPSICTRCWEGPFAMHFGFPCRVPIEGHMYRHWSSSHSCSTTFEELQSSAIAGCVWCQLLSVAVQSELIDEPTRSTDPLQITVRGALEQLPSWSPKDIQMIYVSINCTEVYTLVVHTHPGRLAH